MIFSSPDSLNGALETSFIRDTIFSGEPFAVGLDVIGYDGKIVVYLELFELNAQFIQQVRLANKKLVLYHMGDERGDKDKFLYSKCDLIIRNYYFKDFINLSFHPNILWTPNGYRTGVGPREKDFVKPAQNRKSIASFLGWLDNLNSFDHERKSFREAAIKIQDKLFLLESAGFASGYNVGLYSAIVEDSIFTPCPAGNSPETIRLYDALELGSIPISLRHEFLNSDQALGAIGMPPFPQLDDWSQLPNFLDQMQELIRFQPDKIRTLQKDCLDWWQGYKKYISKKVSNHTSDLI